MSVLWLIDRDGERLQDAFSLLPADSPTNIIVNIRRSTTLFELAAEVRRRAQAGVNLVRVVSHGTSGQLYFSSGVVNASNVGMFQFLRGIVRRTVFEGAAGIEIHGCGVASDYLPPPRREQGIGNVQIANYGNMEGQMAGWPGAENAIRGSRGVRFLGAMADVCGACVRGGVDYQLPDRSWDYEGPSLTVCPGPRHPMTLFDPRNRFGLGNLYRFPG